MLRHADVLVEGFRPGVMERLNLGPADVSALNSSLIYGRMTGWGQDGPLAHAAGHDINYISTTGALAAIGTSDHPVLPLNLVGDLGGGALYLVVGILAVLLEGRPQRRVVQPPLKGQVVDAAIMDGVFSLMSTLLYHSRVGRHGAPRSQNMLDGGAPYYSVYKTLDGMFVSIGAIEPQFFAVLCEKVGIDPSLRDAQHDRSRWPMLRDEFTQIFAKKTRDQWCQLLEASDACFAPVLTLSEAMTHPHNIARSAFVSVDGVTQPRPAPRFSMTPSGVSGAAPSSVTDIAEVIKEWAEN
jgi:alpha-methylacyl-CoA racemase